MAKRIKQTFKDVMDAAFPNGKVVDWNGVSITVKQTIGLADMLSLVKNVVESCFDEAGVYMPELKEFAFRMNVVNRYTDATLPVEADRQYELLYRTDLYHHILDAVDEAQLTVIADAIEDKIQYECDTQMRELRTRLEKMIESFGIIADSTMSMFGGINNEDVEKLVKVASGGKMDEAAVVEAFLEHQKK